MTQLSIHRGIAFTVTEDVEPGFYRFEFTISDRTISGRKETRLPQLALRKAKIEIDKRLKQAGQPASVVERRQA